MSINRVPTLAQIPVLVFFLALSLTEIRATTNVVNQASDSALRSAIAGAGAGDTIRITVTGTIALTNGELVIDKNLNIVGEGSTSTTISGRGASRVLRITRGNVFVNGLAVANGNAGAYTPRYGGGILNYGQLTVSNCLIHDNQAVFFGGTNESGGGIYNAGSLQVENSLFSNNICSTFGGGLLNAGTAAVSGGQFVANRSDSEGAGIENLGTLSITNSGFLYNYALAAGGAGLGNRSRATVEGCEFTGNLAANFGGGGIINYGSLFLTNCSLAANSVTNNSSNPVISGGGALYNAGTAYIYKSQIGEANTAKRGGGILNVGASQIPVRLVMEQSSVTGNTASKFGGGLMNYAAGGSATACLTNVTFAQNKVKHQDFTAAGIDNSATLATARVDLANCTIAENQITTSNGTSTASGIFSQNFGTEPTSHAIVNVHNTIIDLNSADKPIIPQAFGNITSLGHNLCPDTSGPITAATDLHVPSGLATNTLRQLGKFKGYGLPPKSPAIDAGDPVQFPPTDARGASRPFGSGPDIGAFENKVELLQVDVQGTNVSAFFSPYRSGTEVALTFSYDLLGSNYVVHQQLVSTSNYWSLAIGDFDYTTFGFAPCSASLLLTLTGAGSTSSLATNLSDIVPPQITRYSTNLLLVNCATCRVDMPDLTSLVQASDDCSTFTITQSIPAGTKLTNGYYGLNIVVSDASGNVRLAPVNLVVTDHRLKMLSYFMDGVPLYLSLDLVGKPSSPYYLEVSQDLIHWSEVSFANSLPTGEVSFLLSTDLPPERAFYRMRGETQ